MTWLRMSRKQPLPLATADVKHSHMRHRTLQALHSYALHPRHFYVNTYDAQQIPTGQLGSR